MNDKWRGSDLYSLTSKSRSHYRGVPIVPPHSADRSSPTVAPATTCSPACRTSLLSRNTTITGEMIRPASGSLKDHPLGVNGAKSIPSTNLALRAYMRFCVANQVQLNIEVLANPGSLALAKSIKSMCCSMASPRTRPAYHIVIRNHSVGFHFD